MICLLSRRVNALSHRQSTLKALSGSRSQASEVQQGEELGGGGGRRRQVILTQIVARHGDRAPTMNLTEQYSEEERWSKRMPDPYVVKVRAFS